MQWMRSPAGHHLDGPPVSLHHFLHRPENADVASLAGMFRRPTHAAFLRHSRVVAEQAHLDDRVIRGRVQDIQREGEGLLVTGEDVELRARRVLLATGSNHCHLPDWAQRLRDEGAPVGHVFEPEAPRYRDIVGGGISAVQRALMLESMQGPEVRLWVRRPVSVADFDVDRNWTKHRFMGEWTSLSDPERADFLARHRRLGSVPEGVAARLERAVRRGTIRVIERDPRARFDPESGQLELDDGRSSVASEGITLATGFEAEVVSGWLRTVAERLSLPMHGSDLPLLAEDMEWGHGIHVTGPLARLRLGPMAGNVVGARWATSKLPGVRMQPV